MSSSTPGICRPVAPSETPSALTAETANWPFRISGTRPTSLGSMMQRRQVGQVRELVLHCLRQAVGIAQQRDALAAGDAARRCLQPAVRRVAQLVGVGRAVAGFPGDGVLQHPVGALLVDVAGAAAADLRHGQHVGHLRIGALQLPDLVAVVGEGQELVGAGVLLVAAVQDVVDLRRGIGQVNLEDDAEVCPGRWALAARSTARCWSCRPRRAGPRSPGSCCCCSRRSRRPAGDSAAARSFAPRPADCRPVTSSCISQMVALSSGRKLRSGLLGGSLTSPLCRMKFSGSDQSSTVG